MTKVREEGLDQYELAIRSWADHDPKVRLAVQAVYRQRAKFVRQFFTRLGFDNDESEIRTRLVLCSLSWEPTMLLKQSATKQRAFLKQQHELLTRR